MQAGGHRFDSVHLHQIANPLSYHGALAAPFGLEIMNLPTGEFYLPWLALIFVIVNTAMQDTDTGPFGLSGPPRIGQFVRSGRIPWNLECVGVYAVNTSCVGLISAHGGFVEIQA